MAGLQDALIDLERRVSRLEKDKVVPDKKKLRIADASVDAALDAWFGYKHWRDLSDATLRRSLMRKALDAAIDAAMIEEVVDEKL